VTSDNLCNGRITRHITTEHTIELQFVKAAVEGAEICDLLDDLDITANQKETFIKTLITDQLLYSKKNLYDVVASVNGEVRPAFPETN